jgi:antitoxin VapB
MTDTAKIFTTGRSQAVRLPKEYRFEGSEVFVRRDPSTGDVILSRKPGSWGDFFKLMAESDVPADFMENRQDDPAEERNLF